MGSVPWANRYDPIITSRCNIPDLTQASGDRAYVRSRMESPHQLHM